MYEKLIPDFPMPTEDIVAKQVAQVMDIYCNLPIDGQVPFFKALKDEIIKHRNMLIKQRRDELEIMECNLKKIVVEFEHVLLNDGASLKASM